MSLLQIFRSTPNPSATSSISQSIFATNPVAQNASDMPADQEWGDPFTPETPEEIALLMEHRMQNVGFVIGKALRRGFEGLGQKTYNLAGALSEYFVTVKDEVVRLFAHLGHTVTFDRFNEDKKKIREFKNPEYSHLSQEAQLCMLLVKKPTHRYPRTVKIYVAEEKNTTASIKNVLIQAIDAYSIHANIRIEFVKDKKAAYVAVFPIGSTTVNGWAEYPDGVRNLSYASYQLKQIALNQDLLSADSKQLAQHVAQHEMGHSFFNMLHPFELHIRNPQIPPAISSFLDHLEITSMTYNKYLNYAVNIDTREGISFCDSVVAIELYGQNLSQRRQAVNHDLKENTDKSFILSNQGGIGILNAKHLTAKADFVVQPGFEPIRIKGSLYYLGHKSPISILYSTPFADTIRLGNQEVHLELTPGEAKTIIIQPACVTHHIYGFNWRQDIIVLQGFPDAKQQPYNFSTQDNHLTLTLSNQTQIIFYHIPLDAANSMRIIHSSSQEDGIQYHYSQKQTHFICLWDTLTSLIILGVNLRFGSFINKRIAEHNATIEQCNQIITRNFAKPEEQKLLMATLARFTQLHSIAARLNDPFLQDPLLKSLWREIQTNLADKTQAEFLANRNAIKQIEEKIGVEAVWLGAEQKKQAFLIRLSQNPPPEVDYANMQIILENFFTQVFSRQVKEWSVYYILKLISELNNKKSPYYSELMYCIPSLSKLISPVDFFSMVYFQYVQNVSLKVKMKLNPFIKGKKIYNLYQKLEKICQEDLHENYYLSGELVTIYSKLLSKQELNQQALEELYTQAQELAEIWKVTYPSTAYQDKADEQTSRTFLNSYSTTQQPNSPPIQDIVKQTNRLRA